ncbi:MAG: hypothetical protein JRI68_10050 [Deltaproteobacteria bacterium]|nr:hypothetical protein [Deltaproteobacteria bacterium]
MKSSDQRSSHARPRARWLAASLGAATLVAALGLTTPAAAFFPQRYVACHEEGQVAKTVQVRPEPPPRPPATPQLLPLARKRAPRPLTIAPLVVIDVARSEPLPASGAHPEPSRIAVARAPERKRLVQVESRNDYLCIGLPRGTAGILRVLGAPPGTRYYHRGRSESWRRRNMRAAGAFGLHQATEPLRRQLARPIVAGLEGYQLTEHLQLKLAAGLALADLEDHAAAPALLAFVRSRELQSYPVVWEDALDPLARLDPLLAQQYAIEALTRVADRPGQIRQGRRVIRHVLPLLTGRSPRALQELRRVSALLVEPDGDPDGHDACLVLGARARLGDEPLLAELRPELAVELRTQRGVACYSELISHVFPGRDPAEVPTLTHRQRYWEILALLRTMRDAERAGQQDPGFAVARAKLRSWLTQRAGEPDVRGDPTHRDNNPERRALHLSALAFLGDRQARTQLDELIRDPADTGTAPWLAAHQALLLELPGAADLAAVRLGLAMTSNTRRFTQRSWTRRGLVRVTEHVEVIDELARRGDPRFALGLLDRNIFAREATVLHLARHRPPEACEIVGKAARRAQRESIQDAFWALSILGGACRDTMGRLARDRDEPPEVRGMALEALAMLRDSAVPALLKHPVKRGLKAAQGRAKIIHEARE